jgi:4a-hydroxytetrahydrobiopterin dehydratase
MTTFRRPQQRDGECRMDKLSQEQIDERLTEVPEWSVNGDALQRTYRFDDFREAMVFVNRVADLAEDHQHHPDILIRYNKVTLTVTTHDASGITEKDFALAMATDGYVAAT